MSTFLRLNDAARIRLQAQVNLTGTFHHTLRNELRVSAQVVVEIDQCDRAVCATVRGGPLVNSITLDKGSRTNALRLARFIESATNGYSLEDIGLEVGEYELADEMERTLRDALRRCKGTHYLPTDDTDTCLLMRKDSAGNSVATLEAEGMEVQATLPRDRRQAFEALRDKVASFLASHRTARAA